MINEIAPGVYTADRRGVEGKNGIVIGKRGALAIDSGNDREEAGALADFILDRGKPPCRLAFTHGHGAHIFGSGVFSGAEIFASSLTPEVMRRQVVARAEREGGDVREVEAEVCFPTVTFSQELYLDLGDKNFRFIPTPGHSVDSVSIYGVEDAVLFAGDAVVTATVPALSDGNSHEMEDSLHRLLDMEIDLLVPGHGPALRGWSAIQDHLEWQASYLAEIRIWVREQLRKGASPDSLADAAGFEVFVRGRYPKDRYDMERRHRDVVEKIAREESPHRSPEA
ncbi:MAG: MBL fold metallo-hydrolase [Armatimonadetes bacterium]|nr:MBL fold metallo-hydrolase [Armatimonadota bacterium]